MRALYAVVRYIPNMLREEFVNVGVILVCPETRFQGLRYLPSFGDDSRAKALSNWDGHFVRHALTKLRYAFDHKQLNSFIEEGVSPEGILTPSGLHRLRAFYHNNIQLSEPRSALTSNPEETLEKLFHQFVAVPEEGTKRLRVTRQAMRKQVSSVFRQAGLFERPEVKQDVKPPVPAPKIDFAYQNDVMHYYQLIPFTGTEKTSGTVQSYRMTARDVRSASGLDTVYQDAKFAVLGYYPSNLVEAGETDELLHLLRDDGIETLDYEDAHIIARQIANDLAAHPSKLIS